MNEEGTAEVPRGERGEIWVRSPTIMKGYWRNEKATKETLTSDGWLRTGDIVHLAEDGQIYVVDRKKASNCRVHPIVLANHLLGIDQSQGLSGGSGGTRSIAFGPSSNCRCRRYWHSQVKKRPSL